MTQNTTKILNPIFTPKYGEFPQNCTLFILLLHLYFDLLIFGKFQFRGPSITGLSLVLQLITESL
jgi:hypothetical protein